MLKYLNFFLSANRFYMKNTFFLKLLFLCCLQLSFLLSRAQTEVHISDPQNWNSSSLSKYVGQTVVFDVPFYICNNYYYKTGTYIIAPHRIFAPTNQALPASSEYYSLIKANENAEIEINGISGYHRMGEKLYNLQVYVNSSNSVSFKSCDFRGNTRQDMQTLPSVDLLAEHTLLVCAFNLEYYLVENLGTGYGPGSKSDSDKQHSKIMDALTHIKADIFGFVEIEGGPTALRKLATSLTAATGFEYTFSEDDAYSNGSFTKAGYVYRKDRVKQVGKVTSNNTATSNRKKVTMFEEIATGERFLLSVNHFKAKSGTGNGADADQKDGQGIFNATRTNEANSVLSSDMDKLYQDPDILVVGDLNAYAKEDPIQAFINAGYTDLHRAFHKDTSYSYVFRDQAGYLDHALASKTLYPQVTGMAAYHINSDEHDGFTYDKSSDLTMFRSSDHDPVLIGLRLSNEPLYKWQPIVKQDNSLVLSADNNSLSARVFTLTGFLYSQVELSAGQELNLSDLHLPKGVYIIELYGGQHQHKAQKVIVTQ